MMLRLDCKHMDLCELVIHRALGMGRCRRRVEVL